MFHQADSVRYVLLPHYFTKLAGHHVHVISFELKCIYQNGLKDGQNLYVLCSH